MKAEAWIFTFLAIYFFAFTGIYGYATYRADGHPEWAGTLALALAGVLGAMISAMFALTGRKIDKRPEDDPDGEIFQTAGEYGFFPPQSSWPFWCALAAGVMALAPVFGWWILIIGVGVGAWAVAGWCYEFYRGDYAH